MGNIITRTDAEALIPVESSKEIIQAVQHESAVLQLMKKLPNMSSKQTKMPIMSALPVAGFVNGDNGLKPVSSASWENKYITAEEIAVIIPIPEAVLDDAEYDIWAELKPSIISAFGKVIDGAVLFSTEKPTSWPDGIATSAIQRKRRLHMVQALTQPRIFPSLWDLSRLTVLMLQALRQKLLLNHLSEVCVTKTAVLSLLQACRRVHHQLYTVRQSTM